MKNESTAPPVFLQQIIRVSCKAVIWASITSHAGGRHCWQKNKVNYFYCELECFGGHWGYTLFYCQIKAVVYTVCEDSSVITLQMTFICILVDIHEAVALKFSFLERCVFLKGTIQPKMKIIWKCAHPRYRLVCFFIRFVEMCLCISVSAMDALQWMGAVRMRVQTADKNITIIHSTPVHQLTSGEDKSSEHLLTITFFVFNNILKTITLSIHHSWNVFLKHCSWTFV